MNNRVHSKVIRKLLAPALKLWLRSQVEHVEALQVEIAGSDSQILQGYVPNLYLACESTLYQGLHLRQLQLKGENIRINLGQVLKGRPLQLLEPIRVTAEVVLTEADLATSLSSFLLSQALTDLLRTLLNQNSSTLLKDCQMDWQQATLKPDKVEMVGRIIYPNNEEIIPLTLRAGLALANRHTLCLSPLQVEALPIFNLSLSHYPIDLGTDVEITSLSLTSHQLYCSGRLTVVP